MKNILLLLLVGLAFFKIASGQCVPQPFRDIPGFCPPASALPCIERGVPYDQTGYFEFFDSISVLAITQIRIDSISGLPTGISCNISLASTIKSGETACFKFTGASADSAGVYQIRIYLTFTAAGIGTFSIELSEFEDEILFGGAIIPDTTSYQPIFYPPYYLRVIEPGTSCTISGVCKRDSLVSAIMPEPVYSNSKIFPNPATDLFTLALSGNHSNFDLQILDVSGRIVQSSHHLSGNNLLVDINNLENGMYFYKVVEKSRVITQAKLMIIR